MLNEEENVKERGENMQTCFGNGNFLHSVRINIVLIRLCAQIVEFSFNKSSENMIIFQTV